MKYQGWKVKVTLSKVGISLVQQRVQLVILLVVMFHIDQMRNMYKIIINFRPLISKITIIPQVNNRINNNQMVIMISMVVLVQVKLVVKTLITNSHHINRNLTNIINHHFHSRIWVILILVLQQQVIKYKVVNIIKVSRNKSINFSSKIINNNNRSRLI